MSYLEIVARISFEAKSATKDMKTFKRDLTSFEKNVGDTMKKSSWSIGKMALGFYVAMKAAKSFFGRMVSDSPALGVQLELLNWEFSEIFRTIGDSLAPVMADIVEWVHGFVEEFKEGWARMEGDIGAFWEKIKPAIGGLLDSIGGFFDGFLFDSGEAIAGVFSILEGLIDFGLGVFTGDWSKIWEGVVNIAEGAVPLIQKICNNIWKLLSDMVKGLGAMFEEIWEYLVWVQEEGRGPPPGAEPWETGPPSPDQFEPPWGGGGEGVPPKASVVNIPITIHPTLTEELDMMALAQKLAEILRSMFENLDSW